MLKRAMTAALCGVTMAVVSATPALANTGVGVPWFEDGPNGERWGCKWISDAEAVCIRLNGPQAGRSFKVEPEPDGSFVVVPEPGAQAPDEAWGEAQDLEDVLNGPAAAIPSPGPASAFAQPPGTVPFTRSANCTVTFRVDVGKAGSPQQGQPASVSIDWGDGTPPASFSSSVGSWAAPTHTYSKNGDGAAYSWREGPRGATFIDTYRVSIALTTGGQTYYGGLIAQASSDGGERQFGGVGSW